MTTVLQRVQVRFLKELFRSAKTGFVLKGGMALAMLYGASRLTRDVDLDFPPPDRRTAESLHNQVMRALQQALRGSGIVDVRINQPGKGEISPKWRISGKDPHGDEFRMKVEVSRRAPPPGEVMQATVSGHASLGLGTYYVDVYDQPTLAAMKLSALLGRTAVRDVYDLDLLLPVHSPGTSLVHWTLENAELTSRDAAKAVDDKLSSMSFSLFQSQMVADTELMSRISPTAWDEMKTRVGTSLASLLEADDTDQRPS